MKELSALEIIKELEKQGILYKEKYGVMQFTFLDLKVTKVNVDAVGYVFQNWLSKWFVKNDIFFEEPKNSQESPDFFLKKKDKKSGLLEVKTFYKSPSFDIQGWDAFLNLMIEKPYHIFSDYLIFHYYVDLENNNFGIKDLFLKKIWEISRPMGTRAKIPFKINVQYKNNTIVNIRPSGLKDLNETKSSHFKDHKEFLNAVQETIDMYSKSNNKLKNGKWLNIVKKNYSKITKKELF